MAVSRKRRLIKRAVWTVLAALLLLALLIGVLPSDKKRSRALRLGMTRAEVEAVMGQQDGSWGVGKPPPGGAGGGGSGISNGAYFGKSIVLKRRVGEWIGINSKVRHEDWPVRVRFDDDDRLDLIQRDGEPAEEAP